MLKERVFIVIMIMLGCFIFTACATSTKKATYDGLNLSYATYDSALNILADLHKEGKLTDEQKNDAIQIGRAYKLTHNAAVVAFLKYELSKDADDENAYLVAFTESSTQLAKLIKFAREIIDEKKGAR